MQGWREKEGVCSILKGLTKRLQGGRDVKGGGGRDPSHTHTHTPSFEDFRTGGERSSGNYFRIYPWDVTGVGSGCFMSWMHPTPLTHYSSPTEEEEIDEA